MEADKTVSTQIEVSDLTTAFQTQVVPMPICKYEILNGGPTGEPVQFATIGQQVYHKWTCDSETVDTFCAVVHSCTVDDGNGDTVQILDENGCALDKFLLNNLEYPTDLMAGQEAHVYKYADRSQLFYQCQISITVKEPNEECARPTCSEPQGFGAVKQANQTAQFFRVLKKRSAPVMENILDVRAELTTLEVLEGNVSCQNGVHLLIHCFQLPSSLTQAQALVASREIGEDSFRQELCISSFHISVVTVFLGLTVFVAIFITYMIVSRMMVPSDKMQSAC